MQALPIQSPLVSTSSAPEYVNIQQRESPAFSLFKRIHKKEKESISLNRNDLAILNKHLSQLLKPCQLNVGETSLTCPLSFAKLFEVLHAKAKQLGVELKLYLCLSEVAYLLGFDTLQTKLEEKNINIEKVCGTAYTDGLKASIATKPRYFTIHLALSLADKKTLTCLQDAFIRYVGQNISIKNDSDRQNILTKLLSTHPQHNDWAMKNIDTKRLQFYAADEMAISHQMTSKGVDRQLRIVLVNTEGVTINFVFSQQHPRTCRVRNFKIPFGIAKAELTADLAEISLAPIIDKVCLISTPLIDPLKKENYAPLIKDLKNLITSMVRGETCRVPGLTQDLLSLFFTKAKAKAKRSRNFGEIMAYHLNKALARMVQEDPKGIENRPYSAFALTLATCELFQSFVKLEDLNTFINKMMVHWSGRLDQPLLSLLAKALQAKVSYRLISAILHLGMLKELHSPGSTSLTIYKSERGHRTQRYAQEEILQLELGAPTGSKYYFSVVPETTKSIKEIFHCSIVDTQNEIIDHLFETIFKQKTSFQDFWTRILSPEIANSLESVFHYVIEQFKTHANDDHCQRCLEWFCCLADSFLSNRLLLNFVAGNSRQDTLLSLYSTLGSSSEPTLNTLVYLALKKENDLQIQISMANALCKGNPRLALNAFNSLASNEKVTVQQKAKFIESLCESLNEESFHLLEELIPFLETLGQTPLRHALWLANAYIDCGQFQAAQALLPHIKKSERRQVSKRLNEEKLEPLLAFAKITRKELRPCDTHFDLAKRLLEQESSKKFSFLAQLFQFPETVIFFANKPEDWWNEIIFPTLAQLSKANQRDRYLAGLICLGAFKAYPPEKNRFPELLSALHLVFANLSDSSVSSYLKAALLENLPILLKGLEEFPNHVLEAALMVDNLSFVFPKESLPSITNAMISNVNHSSVQRLLLVVYHHQLNQDCLPNLKKLFAILIEQTLSNQIEEAFKLLQKLLVIALPDDEIVLKFMAACVKHNKKHFFEWLSNHIPLQSLTQEWRRGFYALYNGQDIPGLLKMVETEAFAKLGISSQNAHTLISQLFAVPQTSPHYFQALHVAIKLLPYLQNQTALVEEFFSRLAYCDLAFKRRCWEQLKNLTLLPFESKIICWQSLFNHLKGSSAPFFREVFENPSQFPLLNLKNIHKAQAVEILFQEISKRKLDNSLFASIKNFYANLKKQAIQGTTSLNYAKILIARKDSKGIEVLLESLKSWFQRNGEWPESHIRLVENVFMHFSKEAEKLMAFITILEKHPHPSLGLHLVNCLRNCLQADKATLLILLQKTMRSSQTTQNHRLHLNFHFLFSKLQLKDYYLECGNSTCIKSRIQSLFYLSSNEVKSMHGQKWVSTRLRQLYAIFFTKLTEDPILPDEVWICALSGLTFLKGDQNFSIYFRSTCDLLLRKAVLGPVELQWTLMKELHRVVPLWSESTGKSLAFNQEYFDLAEAILEAAIYYPTSPLDPFVLEITKTLRQSFSNPKIYSKEFANCVGFCSLYLFNRLLAQGHSDELKNILDDFNEVRRNEAFRQYAPDFMLAIDLLMEAQNFLHKKINGRPQIAEFLNSRNEQLTSFAINKMGPSINNIHFAILYIFSITSGMPINVEDAKNPCFMDTLEILEQVSKNIHQLKGPLYSLFMQKIISCFLQLQVSTLKNLETYEKTDGVALAGYITGDLIAWRKKRDPQFQEIVDLQFNQITDPRLQPNGASTKLADAFKNFALVQENLLQLVSSTIKLRIAVAIKETVKLYFENLNASKTSTSEICTLSHTPDLILALATISKDASLFRPDEIEAMMNKFLDNLARTIQAIRYIPSVFYQTPSEYFKYIVELIAKPEFIHKRECLTRLVNILEETGKLRKMEEFHQAAEYVLTLAKEKGIVIHQASTSGSPSRRKINRTKRK